MRVPSYDLAANIQVEVPFVGKAQERTTNALERSVLVVTAPEDEVAIAFVAKRKTKKNDVDCVEASYAKDLGVAVLDHKRHDAESSDVADDYQTTHALESSNEVLETVDLLVDFRQTVLQDLRLRDPDFVDLPIIGVIASAEAKAVWVGRVGY